ncbi:MAG: nucleoside triphosphate pyrophosphatase [Chromatiales bacterium]|jgi:septum formation protein
MLRTLVLASTSAYRQELLARLGLPFETASPEIDETRHKDEEPEALVQRLSLEKAKAVASKYPDALIIGSDQVATLDDTILGKPGTHERAMEQLKAASGQSVIFLTGLSLYDSATGRSHTVCEPFRVDFRDLTEEEIDDYLRREEPYDCAGSFKSEGLGIALFSLMDGEDPNSLIGLPLIQLVSMLQENGIHVLGKG